MEKKDATTLTIKDLEQYAWSAEQCLIMLKEAREEEKKLDGAQKTDDELRAALGLTVHTSLSNNSTTTETPTTIETPTTKSTGRVAVPLPHRYPTGGEPYVS